MDWAPIPPGSGFRCVLGCWQMAFTSSLSHADPLKDGPSQTWGVMVANTRFLHGFRYSNSRIPKGNILRIMQGQEV